MVWMNSFFKHLRLGCGAFSAGLARRFLPRAFFDAEEEEEEEEEEELGMIRKKSLGATLFLLSCSFFGDACFGEKKNAVQK